MLKHALQCVLLCGPRPGATRWALTRSPRPRASPDIIVPTQDSARYTFLLDTAIQHGQPILLVGPHG